jgi:hypothetical protein
MTHRDDKVTIAFYFPSSMLVVEHSCHTVMSTSSGCSCSYEQYLLQAEIVRGGVSLKVERWENVNKEW